ncbi:hypothetical protein AC579_7520 [Pseudocercospora musae]|uniref:Uncharacterized protein n=1 Tax=Pseudocercospora musae TaxID=113226 RepID=A0A139I7D5_9PEZI|nr:hypothetical protein AC579_7520 [Pseudocercospora musae]
MIAKGILPSLTPCANASSASLMPAYTFYMIVEQSKPSLACHVASLNPVKPTQDPFRSARVTPPKPRTARIEESQITTRSHVVPVHGRAWKEGQWTKSSAGQLPSSEASVH